MLDFQTLTEDDLTENRDRLLVALAERQVIRVTITYEGSGDSGDVSEVSVEPPELMPRLLDDTIELRCLVGEYKDRQYLRTMADRPMNLRAALAEFALTWVEDTHAGWEINDGSQGTVTIAVAERTLTLEHTEYYTESQDYVHAL